MLTPEELAQIRIKCVEIFVVPCSKVGLEHNVPFDKGEKLFEVVKKEIMEAGFDKAQLPRNWYK
jgi:hypothetical protein